MSQTKRQSLIESVSNTAIAFIITLSITPFVFWVSDVKASYSAMTCQTVIFTGVAILRNYIIRRYFNRKK